ncbi:MAG: autotransporter-associated beta strand repeat-containing protein, partial [Oscillospiraceae bacterium]|nr:autotransporter-associated beta strand repeat-containing protein [Oscillospiraceae bacterium]
MKIKNQLKKVGIILPLIMWWAFNASSLYAATQNWTGTKNFTTSQTITDDIHFAEYFIGINVSAGVTVTITGNLTGINLHKRGEGTLVLTSNNTGYNTYGVPAIAYIEQGTLQLGNGESTGDLPCPIRLQATGSTAPRVVLNHSGSITLAGRIEQTGNIIKEGSGTIIVTRTPANPFKGNLTVNSGRIQCRTEGGDIVINGGVLFGDASDFGGAKSISLNGGHLELPTSGTINLNNLKGTSATSELRTGTGTAYIRLNATENCTFAGRFVGSGSGVINVYTAPYKLTLTGDHTGFSKGLDIGSGILSSGTATLELTNATLSGASNVLIYKYGTLRFVPTANIVWGKTFEGTGNIVVAGSGGAKVSFSSDQTADCPITIETGGTLCLGNGGATGMVSGADIKNNGKLQFNLSGDVVFGTKITGTGAIEKLLSNTVTLTNTNTCNGSLTVSAGTFQIGNGSTGKLDCSGISIASVAKLRFVPGASQTYTGNITGTGGNIEYIGTESKTITLSGSTFSYSGTTTITSGVLTFADCNTLSTSNIILESGGRVIFKKSSGELTFANNISGTGTVEKSGAGKLIFTGAKSFTGVTKISAGKLQLGNGTTAGELTNTTEVKTLAGTALRFHTASNQTFSKLISGDGNVEFLAGNTSSTYKNFYLTSNNMYSGNTIIEDGYFYLGDNSAGGSAAGSIAGNVVFSGTENVRVLYFGRSSDVTFDKNISGPGSVWKTGSSTKKVTLTGALSYT